MKKTILAVAMLLSAAGMQVLAMGADGRPRAISVKSSPLDQFKERLEKELEGLNADLAEYNKRPTFSGNPRNIKNTELRIEKVKKSIQEINEEIKFMNENKTNKPRRSFKYNDIVDYIQIRTGSNSGSIIHSKPGSASMQTSGW